jgi:hypothetical protein
MCKASGQPCEPRLEHQEECAEGCFESGDFFWWYGEVASQAIAGIRFYTQGPPTVLLGVVAALNVSFP